MVGVSVVARCDAVKSFNLSEAFSISHRGLYRRLLKPNGCFLLLRLGVTGLAPCSRNSSRNSRCFDVFSLRMSRAASGQS